jgi:hypothetical protein
MFLHIEGAWNLETSLAYQLAITEASKPLYDKPWVAITVLNVYMCKLNIFEKHQVLNNIHSAKR